MGLKSFFLLPALAACVGCWCPAQAEEGSRKPPTSLQRQALGFLKTLPREWSGWSNRDCKTYEDKNIDQLSAPFAISAAAFLSAFVELHGQVTVTSAHRSAQEQSCVCEGERGPCAGRPRVIKLKKKKRIIVRSTSNHQRGIALDVRAGTGSEDEFACMHEFPVQSAIRSAFSDGVARQAAHGAGHDGSNKRPSGGVARCHASCCRALRQDEKNVVRRSVGLGGARRLLARTDQTCIGGHLSMVQSRECDEAPLTSRSPGSTL